MLNREKERLEEEGGGEAEERSRNYIGLSCAANILDIYPTFHSMVLLKFSRLLARHGIGTTDHVISLSPSATVRHRPAREAIIGELTPDATPKKSSGFYGLLAEHENYQRERIR